MRVGRRRYPKFGNEGANFSQDLLSFETSDDEISISSKHTTDNQFELMTYLMPTEIESQRLILRTFEEEDWKDLHEYYSDEQAMTYTIGRMLSEAETWRAMASMIGHWSLRGYGPYALQEKDSGKVIGISGLWFPNDWPQPEIKWGLNRAFQGKGYAREAALKVKKVAKEFLPNTSLISLIHSENKPSIRLAQAIDARFEKEISFREGRWHIYRHS